MQCRTINFNYSLKLNFLLQIMQIYGENFTLQQFVKKIVQAITKIFLYKTALLIALFLQ